MNIIEIINKKKNGETLSKDEIYFFVDSYVNEKIADYQMSSLLMAILIRGMNDRETSALTFAMRDSGKIVNLSDVEGIKIDKHSTGGVGDKVTLSLSPLLASCGLIVGKMSGRGLGHTGGTLDKLESVPGLTTSISEEKFKAQLKDIGLAIIGQAKDLVPADKKMYALRDVTGTVDSIPLIASSIMSKKLASGADTILLDVKFGKGAFMKTKNDALILAETMKSIGTFAKKDTRYVLSDMNEPLGYAVGNSLEMIEAIETLKGKGPKDFTEKILEEGAIILEQAKIEPDKEKAVSILKEKIDDGSALLKLKQMIEYQGGNPNVTEDYSLFKTSKFKTEIKGISGKIKEIDALKIGILSSEIGAGRMRKEDDINPAVGIVLNKKVGDEVETEEVLCTVHHDTKLSKDYIERLQKAFVI